MAGLGEYTRSISLSDFLRLLGMKTNLMTQLIATKPDIKKTASEFHNLF